MVVEASDGLLTGCILLAATEDEWMSTDGEWGMGPLVLDSPMQAEPVVRSTSAFCVPVLNNITLLSVSHRCSVLHMPSHSFRQLGDARIGLASLRWGLKPTFAYLGRLLKCTDGRETSLAGSL